MLKSLFGLGKNDLFNQALEQFRKLRYLFDDEEKYLSTVLEVIRLCQLAIQKNKSDGDAHVLLANAYYLAALKILGEGYTYCLPRAVAVIYEWKINHLHTKNQANGEKVYQDILESIERPMPNWTNMTLTGDMSDMYRKYYYQAINPETTSELRRALTESDTIQTEKITDENANMHILTAALYRQQGRLDETVRELQAGLHLNPDNADMHILLGTVFMELGHLDKAIQELQVGLRIKPDDADAHFTLGTFYTEQGRWDEAIREYQIVLQINPDYANIHSLLGTAYLRQGQLDKAIQEFQIGLKTNPNDTTAHFLLGRSYQKKGRIEDAVREYRIVLQINPDDTRTYFTLGELYIEQGQLDQAVREIQAGLYIDPDNCDAHFLLSSLYEQQGHKDKFIRELQIAARLGSIEAQRILTQGGKRI